LLFLVVKNILKIGKLMLELRKLCESPGYLLSKF
jgi:hypothetical protein